jgi:hypothetical protein
MADLNELPNVSLFGSKKYSKKATCLGSKKFFPDIILLLFLYPAGGTLFVPRIVVVVLSSKNSL